MSKRDARPIPTLTPRKQRAFEQQITKTDDGHWLWCVNGDTWWGRFRTEDASWNGPEFRTEAGPKLGAARVACVHAGLADDPRYVPPSCGEERCIAPDHQRQSGGHNRAAIARIFVDGLYRRGVAPTLWLQTPKEGDRRAAQPHQELSRRKA